MQNTINRKAVDQLLSQLFHEEYDRLVSQGKSKTDEKIIKSVMKKISEMFSPNELAEAFLYPRAEQKWKEQAKSHSISSILARTETQGSLFPDELDTALISLGGVTVPLPAAEIDIVDQQERAYIDNNIKQNAAFSRNMRTIGPIRSLMIERGCTAGQALEILRNRK